jgi:hypothetical protein
VVAQTNIFFFVGKSCKVDGSLLLLNRANLEGSPLLGDSLLGLHRLLSLLETIAKDTSVSNSDGEMENLLLDLGKEVKNNALLRYAEDLGVEVAIIFTSKYIVAFTVRIIIGVIDNVDQAVVAHAAREGWLDDLGVSRPSDFTRDPVNHGDVIVVDFVEIMLH